jgi:RNA polymerase sigma-70 factor (ECF subfamily)
MAGEERVSFDALVRPLLPRLRSFALRMVAHPDDAEELVQDALLKAHQAQASFQGRSSVSTWVFSILTRCCLDHLRKRRRWRWDAQHHTRVDPEAPHGEVLAALAEPGAVYDAREHIAFCFSCVARSLSAEEAAALLLREVFAFSNREAAQICGVSESVLRHRLSAGRHAMQDAYEGLCGLVAKTGVCHQCAGLRDNAPQDNRGPEVPVLPAERDARWRVRLRVVRDADLLEGSAAALHRLMFRAVERVESR